MPLYDDKAFARAIAAILRDSKTIEIARATFLQLYNEDGIIVEMLTEKNKEE